MYDQGSYAITYHEHPGHLRSYYYDKDVWHAYAKTINGHRAGFTGSSILRYVLAKYFEIPSTGALLLADAAVSRQLTELGLIENQHYLPVSAENLEERGQYVLDERNHEELGRSGGGQALILERHKTSDRTRQINEVCTG